jgi:hypothetical protein
MNLHLAITNFKRPINFTLLFLYLYVQLLTLDFENLEMSVQTTYHIVKARNDLDFGL